MSGTVAVRSATEEGRGGSGCLSRLDSDGCGHFRRLFLYAYVWEKVGVWGHRLMLCSDCSPQWKSSCSRANSRGRKSKHIAWLSWQTEWFCWSPFWLFLFLVERPEDVAGSLVIGPGEWFSQSWTGTWRLCKRTSTERFTVNTTYDCVRVLYGEALGKHWE